MRTAYRCRAYPDEQQQAVLRRTFGCVRVVWNRTLATRRARYYAEGKGISYAETDRALTEMKRDPDLAFLTEVSSVPLQQTCSTCGHVLAELELSIRRWTCPSCRTRHDRDVNAAKNILAAGLAVTACGAGVRHSGGPPGAAGDETGTPGREPGNPHPSASG
jgi:transposase